HRRAGHRHRAGHRMEPGPGWPDQYPRRDRRHGIRGRDLLQHPRGAAQLHRRVGHRHGAGHRVEPEREWRSLRPRRERWQGVCGGMVYPGGHFGIRGGQSSSHIAALDTTTGQATAWNPGANSTVSALAVSGGTVYAGGFFTSIGGQWRSYIAALDTATGLATA